METIGNISRVSWSTEDPVLGNARPPKLELFAIEMAGSSDDGPDDHLDGGHAA